MQLVLDTNGIVVKKRNGSFWITTDAQERIINPAKIDSIAVTAACSLTTSAIMLALSHQIPIYFLDRFGAVKGKLADVAFGKLATLRRQQAIFRDRPEATEWVIALFLKKIAGQSDVLEKFMDSHPNPRQLKEVIEAIRTEKEKMADMKENTLAAIGASLMGMEGSIAKTYWQHLSLILPESFRFVGRSRQPAQDGFNAALNYLYGMLYCVVERAITSAGLDSALGVLHGDQYGKPTLSYDLIEPFRPWIDALLTQEIRGQNVTEAMFDVHNDGSVTLNKTGKQYLIPRFNNFLNEPVLMERKRYPRRNEIFKMTSELADLLEKTLVK
jgi:CRISPR-associated protein Cas1